MKKTVIKCTSRADWGRIIQWAEEIKPDCTYDIPFNKDYYYGFNHLGDFGFSDELIDDYTVLELSDFIAYPVKKEMMVSYNKLDWKRKIIVGETLHNKEKRFVDTNGYWWSYAKPINPNQGETDEIDKQIAELTKRKEALCQ